MKKFLLVCFLLFSLVSISLGMGTEIAGVKIGLNDLKCATFFDFSAKELYWGGTISLMDYQKLLSLDGGAITSLDASVVVGGLSLNLGNFGKLVGVNINPIIKDCQLGFFAGWNLEKKTSLRGIYLGLVWQL